MTPEPSVQSELFLVEDRLVMWEPHGHEYCNQLSQMAALGGSRLQPSLHV